MDKYAVIRVGVSLFIVFALTSNSLEAANKEPSDNSNPSYEQPHLPDNQQSVPEFPMFVVNSSSGTVNAVSSRWVSPAILIAMGS